MSKNAYVNSYQAGSLHDFYEVVKRINEVRNLRVSVSHDDGDAFEGDTWPLWFRGIERSAYSLIPSLYRKADMDDDFGAYGAMHLREDYRYHFFQARAQHAIRTGPSTRTDWLEIMQHHFMNTRLMDWSETANVALTFALEAYLDPINNADTKLRRHEMDPVVWVIDPTRLNWRVFKALTTEKDDFLMIRAALDDSIAIESDDKWRIAKHLGIELRHKEWFFRPKDSKPSLSSLGLINLSSIDAMRRDVGNRLRDMLLSFEFNPFFYLLARYYLDGVPVALSTAMPPLATVHPYHSNRIEAQHGAFTCFPYYTLNDDEKKRKKYILDPRAMEAQSITDCLYEIRIIHPERVAAQLIDSGVRISHIYPELERFAKDLEATSFHI